MSTARLTIDLDALAQNWIALNAMTGVQTAAVVKADGYGLGVGPVAQRLQREGVHTFFVAVAEEGATLRKVVGAGPRINVFSGHMAGDTDLIRDYDLTPMLNSLEQLIRHVEALPRHAFGVQLDTGMNRLGMEPAEWGAVRDIALAQGPTLLMSHLACADEPDHEMNAQQLATFHEMTEGCDVPRSLSATGGILLGPDYHFDLCRPGIGLYGGLPFVDAAPVAYLSLPVIQIRRILPGETVGYGNSFTAEREMRIATVAAGYADGIHRAMGPKTSLFAGDTRCKITGRISMDLIGVDVTDVEGDPESLELLGRHQFVDTLADNAGTIGYEILTSLGHRYTRSYSGA